jgi:hypothetical protein
MNISNISKRSIPLSLEEIPLAQQQQERYDVAIQRCLRLSKEEALTTYTQLETMLQSGNPDQEVLANSMGLPIQQLLDLLKSIFESK